MVSLDMSVASINSFLNIDRSRVFLNGMQVTGTREIDEQVRSHCRKYLYECTPQLELP